MSMIVGVFGRRLLIVQVFSQRLFHEHAIASIWSETLS